MKTTDLVYVGLLRRVAALERETGRMVWEWEARQGMSDATLLLDRDLLIVSVDGNMYGLEALTGRELWFNPLRGFGIGRASLASVHGMAKS